MKHLVITIHFLSDRYHGRTENGHEPEWPPSPLRLYQAVLAGAASRWRDPAVRERELAAFEWFQGLEPPQIIAPKAEPGRPLLKYVRENLSDVDPEKRDAKFSRPTLFLGEPTVTYFWSIDPDREYQANVVAGCARHCRALGWGIDMVIGNGTLVEPEPKCEAGEKWLPTENSTSGVPLRVPCQKSSATHSGTLNDLTNRFNASLQRLNGEGRNPVPPLTAYRTVGYRRAFDPAPRPSVAFALLNPTTDAMRPFDAVRDALTVAHMTRHAVKSAARLRWPDDEVARIVMGHGEPRDCGHRPAGDRRFSFLPLPTIECRGAGKPSVVGSIRRVMLSSYAADFHEPIDWARRAVPGSELVKPGEMAEPAALLSEPRRDAVVRRYIEAASTWATVTPAVLPGHDDPEHYRRRLRDGVDAVQQKALLERLNSRIDGLIRKAIVQAGFPGALAERALIDWRVSGFLAGVEPAGRYAVPDYLRRFPRLHVRITWRDQSGRPLKIAGPICVGGGRFFGLGLFVGVDAADA